MPNLLPFHKKDKNYFLPALRVYLNYETEITEQGIQYILSKDSQS